MNDSRVATSHSARDADPGAATRAALMVAARTVFARNGFDGASVRMITAEADVNLGAVTYHFGSKRGLYEAVLEAVASEQSAHMVAMRSATDNANDMIRELTLTYNKARQESITKELLELTGGAEVLREER